MKPLKTYIFYKEPSKEESKNICDTLKKHLYNRPFDNFTSVHYDLYYINGRSLLDIYSINILTNEKLLEELFPYFLNMTPIFERNIDHLLQLQ